MYEMIALYVCVCMYVVCVCVYVCRYEGMYVCICMYIQLLYVS